MSTLEGQTLRMRKAFLEQTYTMIKFAWSHICKNISKQLLLINLKGNISKKRFLFLAEVRAISDLITKGIGIPVSDIRNIINEKYGEEIISNKEVKLFMIEHFQDPIKFCQSEHRNESLLAF